MNLNFADLTLLYPEQLFIEFSLESREMVWQQIQNQTYANANSRWRAYLNCLCVNTFLQYLENEPDLQSKTPKIWQETDLPSFWNLVNGTAIEIDNIRLVLIPNQEDQFTELRVPREWIDLPKWAGNYYLAIELNPQECWLRIWGYATHQQLQEEGKYEQINETYSLVAEELIEDLNVMWVAQEICPHQQIEVAAIPNLSTTEAKSLLEILSQSSSYSPRLDIPFVQWGALIANDTWRKELYQRQQKQNIKAEISQAITQTSINLGQWFQQVFAAGWQSLDTLVNAESGNLAFSFRQNLPATRTVTVEGVKLIDLGMQLGNKSVALLIALTRELEDKVSVRVQLHPVGGDTYLPSEIKLALLSQSGKILQEFQSRTQDNFIQLKKFTCPLKKHFAIRVACNDLSITENFLIEISPNNG
ncbi:MAG: DUF1822 family protein [Nostocaceae cyanobacterium]|nr:DUF1822 family protein [Nostocaceae cyanobacterium]